MPEWDLIREYIAEAVKFCGGLASFYAVIKLWQIEKRYLFKATIPELLSKIDKTLSALNMLLAKPSSHRAEISESLNHLRVDVMNVRKKVRGESYRACVELLEVINLTQPSKAPWWRAKINVIPSDKNVLLNIYGKGRGLIRSLEHDVQDQGWSIK